MELSIVWSLLLYILLVFLFLVIAGVNVWHLYRYGDFDKRNRVVGALFSVLSLAVLVVTALYFFSVDWSQTLSFEVPSIETPSLPQL